MVHNYIQVSIMTHHEYYFLKINIKSSVRFKQSDGILGQKLSGEVYKYCETAYNGQINQQK